MPETADRTESLFAAAVALAPEERESYLASECPGDPALRDRLLALLRAHDRAGHVIDRPVIGDPDRTAGYAPTNELLGTIIAGRYKLLEEIGEGGMGTVWVSEQTTPVRRKVALKLIKAGMDSRSVLARFEAERQALALMDDPNIAKVLGKKDTHSSRESGLGFGKVQLPGSGSRSATDPLRLGDPDRPEPPHRERVRGTRDH